LVVFTRMSAPAAQLHLDLQRLVESLPAWERVRDFENELVREADSLGRVSAGVPLPEGAIEFRNVSFVHKAGESADRGGGVTGLALSIEPGTIVGVTGDSGAGKTTFADLLVGLCPPQSGCILVGGVPLAGDTVSRWRDGIGYVAQDAFLFHDTIRNNLLWANPGLDEARLWEGLEIAGIADFVRRSPDGLDMVVGERGSLISGGERQRIALARAILRAARLLVLDEATNAIDLEGERQLLEQLMAIAPRPTIIIVAHRPQTLACCGRILVFSDGRIVADSRETSPQDALAKLDLEPRNVLA
jgi:ATP-binding cassette subfamily C protein